MGDTGPCGPCTEIFYDHGPEIPGGPPGTPDEDGDRYIEIWNLVFMQYNRSADGTLTPLPKPSVDTGMGLERLAAVLQGVHSNYEIDLFQNLIQSAADIIGTKDLSSSSLRVIADHIRSCAFLVADGVYPSNEGRGYVLRRIVRRAIRHGYKLGAEGVFFWKLVAPLVSEMGTAYPELAKAQENVERFLRQEEERFRETLEQGMKILEQDIDALNGSHTLPGDTLFRLYDTFGFPVDLTADIARERGLSVDNAGFERAMDAQRQRARSASAFGVDLTAGLRSEAKTAFCGYDGMAMTAEIVELYNADQVSVSSLKAGESGIAFLASTPFYAESGGQVGDTGQLIAPDGSSLAEVKDTQKFGQAIGHKVTVEAGVLELGDRVVARVDELRRRAIMLNHSATHLLHAALRQVLGDHVLQKGSLVDENRLRFDFAHFEPMTAGQIDAVERIVNAEIRANASGDTKLMPFDEAVAAGAMALFEEKYGDHVRVVSFGDFSVELCGGTHVSRTGDIGLLKITVETGIASGVRRVEAVTGERALNYVAEREATLTAIARLLKASPDTALDKLESMLEKSRKLEKSLEQAEARLASQSSADLVASARDIGGVKVLAAKVDSGDAKVIRDLVDQLKNKLGEAAVVLGGVDESGKVRLVAGVTKALSQKLKAGDLVNVVATRVGGRGGGRPDMAQAGGTDAGALPAALEDAYRWAEDILAQ